jgi:outer membrane receptor for ferrienterochelin and colicins
MNRFLITWVFFLPLGVFAQDVGVGSPAEPGVSAQPSVIQRVEIVARQGSTELRRAASFAKQIYGREELDRYGDTNALDVMRRLPGVNVDSGGPRMRGLGAGYTQILINGDPAPPGFNLDQLSPSQIERIEVIKACYCRTKFTSRCWLYQCHSERDFTPLA